MPNQTRRKQRGGIFNNTRARLANKAKRVFGFTTASNIRNREIFAAEQNARRAQMKAPSKVANLGIHKNNANAGRLGTFRYTEKEKIQKELDAKIQEIRKKFEEKEFDAQAKEVFNNETMGQVKLFLADLDAAIERAKQSKAAQVTLTLGTPFAIVISRVLKIFIGLCLLFIGAIVFAVGAFVGIENAGGILEFAYNLLLFAGAKKPIENTIEITSQGRTWKEAHSGNFPPRDPIPL